MTFNDTPKLAIWNTGPGMDAAELYRMCDLASSIRKQKGLTLADVAARRLSTGRRIAHEVTIGLDGAQD